MTSSHKAFQRSHLTATSRSASPSEKLSNDLIGEEETLVRQRQSLAAPRRNKSAIDHLSNRGALVASRVQRRGWQVR